MTDPNYAYKQAWQELRDVLGREPTVRDKEYWELTNRLSDAYARGRWEEEWNTTNTSADSADKESSADSRTRSATREEESASTTASATSATGASTNSMSTSHSEALRAPGAAAIKREGGTVPGEGNVAPGISQRHSERMALGYGAELSDDPMAGSPTHAREALAGMLIGARGPGGGLVAKCERCGELWERERRRGRPASMCEECRG